MSSWDLPVPWKIKTRASSKTHLARATRFGHRDEILGKYFRENVSQILSGAVVMCVMREGIHPLSFRIRKVFEGVWGNYFQKVPPKTPHSGGVRYFIFDSCSSISSLSRYASSIFR